MPYGDCSLSKKLDNGGHRPLNSATPTTSMAVVQARVLRFSRLRIKEEGGCETPAMPASCSDHDEAGGGNLPGSLDVFPAVPSKRLCGFHGYSNCERAYPLPPRRFGGHGALSRENGKRRGKTVQALAGCSSFRAAVSAVIQFSLRKKEKSLSGGSQSSKSS